MNYKEKLKHINTFIFDFDGVISDGKVWVMDGNDQIRSTDVKDGYALHFAIKKGYRVAVISGGKGESMRLRLSNLGVEDIFQGVGHKIDIYRAYCRENDLRPESILYVGDDIPDYQVMREVGLACCPADAAVEIQEIAHYISHCKGGEGCVRDVIKQVMMAKGEWMQADAFTW